MRFEQALLDSPSARVQILCRIKEGGDEFHILHMHMGVTHGLHGSAEGFPDLLRR